jgi:predicted transcriptional regulator
LTVELPEEVQQKIDLIARERGLSSEALLKDMASEMARQYKAFKLYEEMAAQGRGREAEALALLRRK